VYRVFRNWLRRITFGLAILILAAPLGGLLYQNLCLIRERAANPVPGRLVDVGGYRMHINCAGLGNPPVLLDSGLGDSYIEWQTVQPQIAEICTSLLLRPGRNGL
jgi:hypothetical protein